MTYKDDVNLLQDAGKVLGVLAVDTNVSVIQDTANVSASLFANLVNNVETDDEKWKKRFENYWKDAWGNEGGIKDILINGGLELFSDVTGYRLNTKSSIFEEGIEKYFENESWKDATKRLLTKNGEVNSKVNIRYRDTAVYSDHSFGALLRNLRVVYGRPSERLFIPSTDKFFDNPPLPVNSEKKIPRSSNLNSAVSEIFDAGPLLFSNMFDVAFILNKKPNADVVDIPQKNAVLFLKNVNDISNHLETTKVQNEVLTSDFSVRVASVSIPFPVQSTFQTKVLETSMERPTSKIEFDNQARLSIDMDANLYYLDLFNALAGHRAGSYLNSTGQYSNIDSISATNILGSPYYELSIAVTSRTLHMYSKYKYNPAAEGEDHSNICYIFRDVRFLGGSKIEFNKTSSGNVQADFEFIFRTVDPIYKTSETIKRDTKKDDILRVGGGTLISEEGFIRSSIKV